MLKVWYREYLESGALHKKTRLGYTSEQRVTAVQYYLEHGRSLARTVRALGITKLSKATLYRRFKELEESQNKIG